MVRGQAGDLHRPRSASAADARRIVAKPYVGTRNVPAGDVFLDEAALLVAARAMAREIADNPPLVVQGVKQVLGFGEERRILDGERFAARPSSTGSATSTRSSSEARWATAKRATGNDRRTGGCRGGCDAAAGKCKSAEFPLYWCEGTKSRALDGREPRRPFAASYPLSAARRRSIGLSQACAGGAGLARCGRAGALALAPNCCSATFAPPARRLNNTVS